MTRRGRSPKIPPEERPGWARRITAARRARALSQARLAEIIQASQSVVGEYETGGSEPSLRTFERIAAALRVTPQWLIFGKSSVAVDFSEEPPPDETDDDERFADLMLATGQLLREERMPFDDRTVALLTRDLWREVQAGDPGTAVAERIERAIERRRGILRAARQAMLRSSPV